MEARTELDSVSAVIKSKSGQEMQLETGPGGWWADWLIARILLREAEALILKAPSAGAVR